MTLTPAAEHHAIGAIFEVDPVSGNIDRRARIVARAMPCAWSVMPPASAQVSAKPPIPQAMTEAADRATRILITTSRLPQFPRRHGEPRIAFERQRAGTEVRAHAAGREGSGSNFAP